MMAHVPGTLLLAEIVNSLPEAAADKVAVSTLAAFFASRMVGVVSERFPWRSLMNGLIRTAISRH